MQGSWCWQQVNQAFCFETVQCSMLKFNAISSFFFLLNLKFQWNLLTSIIFPGDVAQWLNTCSARVRTWVCSLILFPISFSLSKFLSGFFFLEKKSIITHKKERKTKHSQLYPGIETLMHYLSITILPRASRCSYIEFYFTLYKNKICHKYVTDDYWVS